MPDGADAPASGAPEWYRKLAPEAVLRAAPAYTGPRAGAPVAPHWGLATQAAQRHGLDPSLLAAVWDFESSGNPGAINKSSGATGLGQVMPRERGFPDRPTQQELLNPETNAEWSARILKSGLQRYGNEDKALAAYLGAIDARGNITGAVDANGTGGNQYIRTVRERQQRYAGAGSVGGAGATQPPAAAPAPADAGAPVWYQKLAGAGQTRPGTPAAIPASPSADGALGKQAVAASWALSNLGSKDFYNLCQRFIEQAYGTGGQYGSAAAAGKALFKTADPAQADVGDLVFFRPDASNGYAGHAAIYLGNGEMVGATNAGVTKDNLLTNPYWKNLLVGFGDPPDAWKGRASDAAVAQGATQLVGAARAAAAPAGSSGGQAPPAEPPAWYRKLTGA
jgi:cell wall-associated NlpC family hydrolase